MSYKVDNAIILAAGTASRFAPLSFERPKALIEVKGEVLIERQIRQLQNAGIENIIVVVGYKKEQFEYLRTVLGVEIIENSEYLIRNNNASIYAVRKLLRNTYICSSDNYFEGNPFERYVDDSYYAAVYADGQTEEWCMTEDENGYINSVTIGGQSAWYMLGHAFWSEEFSRRFVAILEKIYLDKNTVSLLWESIYEKNLDVLKMRIRKYPKNYIYEFDTLDELRLFDNSYIENTRSIILKDIAQQLRCKESDIRDIKVCKARDNLVVGFSFMVLNQRYEYDYRTLKVCSKNENN